MFTDEPSLDKIEPLPEDFNTLVVINDLVPPIVDDGVNVNGDGAGRSGEEKKEREIVLGKNVHTMCFEVKEPDVDDEVTGEREAYMASVLARYRKSLIERTKHHLGYPYNLDFDYGALAQLQHFSINNLGDPFIESNYGVHSRQFEVGVLDWFARLWELEKNEYWGYITNCGTEGNLHGILVGREVFPDGILYASRESHYSVFKAARMYRIECEKVNTLVSGEIDCEDFKAKLLCHKDKSAIINVNIGTTVKGAVDDLDLVIRTLEETGFTHDRFYIHCDGALFGLMMPFVKRAPKVTFKKPIGSVSVSGHKFVGCPMPCGVQITRLEHINALSRNVEYLASRDATIMGSRNGHAPIFLWYTLNRKGYRGFQKEVQKCLRNAHYLKDRLNAAGIGAMLNELSSTVVFERPHDEEFVRKWQLACQGNIAHVVVMPNITVEKLDDFLSELIEKHATWYQDGKFQSPCVASDIGMVTNNASRANWKDPKLYKLFLDLCLKEANNGGKSGGSLKRESWDKIKKIMAAKKNVELSQRQMKNQWDYMKRRYLMWKTLMKNIKNGNDIDTENWGAEKWNDYIKVNPDAKQFRYVGLQYTDELKSLFDGITMTGQAARSPSRTCLFSDGVKYSASSQPEVGSSQIQIDLESSSSIMPSYQRKDVLPKGKRRKSNRYGDLDDRISAVPKTLEKSDGASIEECNRCLDGMQTLQMDDPLYIAACSIFCAGKAHRLQWILLAQKPEEVRITWIKMNAKKLGFL